MESQCSVNYSQLLNTQENPGKTTKRLGSSLKRSNRELLPARISRY
jgi:hypothetical protein